MATVPTVATTSFIPTDLIPAGTKVCSHCLEVKAIDLFPTGGGVCRKCSGIAKRGRESEQIESARQRNLSTKLASLIAQINADHPDVPSLSTLMADLMVGLGGVKGFTGHWITALVSEKTTSSAKLEGFKAVAKFCEKAGEQNAALAALRGMTTDDLNAFVFSLMVEQADGDTDSVMLDLLQQKFAARGKKLILVDDESIVEAAPSAPVTPPALEAST